MQLDTHWHILVKPWSYCDTWPQVKDITNVAPMYNQMGTLVHMGTYRHTIDKPLAMNALIVHKLTYGHIQTHGHIITRGVSKANLYQKKQLCIKQMAHDCI